jgi:hypothetical protein
VALLCKNVLHDSVNRFLANHQFYKPHLLSVIPRYEESSKHIFLLNEDAPCLSKIRV